MRYGSVCSGIEAATAAWHHMGWEPAFFSEIEKFPCAVLAHHYPAVPLHGDFTTIKENEYGKIDLLVGGTPCQSFSVAGLRGGLADDRGNLALEFCRLAQREQPRWIVWENVPGVLSSNGGRDFGSILGALEDLGYGLAYRVLDAQYFGVAQRRRRVFVVGYLGDWRPAAAVLFERYSMSGHPAPSRKARKEIAEATSGGTGGGGELGRERSDLAGPLTAGMHKGPRGTEAVESGHVVTVGFNEDGTARTLTARYDSSPCVDRGPDVVGTLRAKRPGEGGADRYAVLHTATHEVAGTLMSYAKSGGWSNSIDHAAAGYMALTQMPAVAAFQSSQSGVRMSDTHATLDANNGSRRHNGVIIATSAVRRLTPVECERLQGFTNSHQNGGVMPAVSVGVRYGEHQQDTLHCEDGVLNTLPGGHNNNAGHYTKTVVGSAVRRLTPVECERLQGFPDNFTAIPWGKKDAEDCPDGPRYKALGNSMAVPVMRWIGERIQIVDDFLSLL